MDSPKANKGRQLKIAAGHELRISAAANCEVTVLSGAVSVNNYILTRENKTTVVAETHFALFGIKDSEIIIANATSIVVKYRSRTQDCVVESLNLFLQVPKRAVAVLGCADSGKRTLVTSIANSMLLMNRRVILIDLDPHLTGCISAARPRDPMINAGAWFQSTSCRVFVGDRVTPTAMNSLMYSIREWEYDHMIVRAPTAELAKMLGIPFAFAIVLTLDILKAQSYESLCAPIVYREIEPVRRRESERIIDGDSLFHAYFQFVRRLDVGCTSVECYQMNFVSDATLPLGAESKIQSLMRGKLEPSAARRIAAVLLPDYRVCGFIFIESVSDGSVSILATEDVASLQPFKPLRIALTDTVYRPL